MTSRIAAVIMSTVTLARQLRTPGALLKCLTQLSLQATELASNKNSSKLKVWQASVMVDLVCHSSP